PHTSALDSERVIKEIFRPNYGWKIIKDGKIVGCVGLEPDRHRPGIASKEMGYWIGKEYWGQGIITEAAKAVMKYAFSKDGLDLDIMAIGTSPVNKRSQRVIEKLGFEYEGTLRKSYKVYDGSLRDVLCYSKENS
ncbi:MAG: GNAT family N-acetyltransferase, partial [Anaerovoracaceae bacterium]